ncbi:transcription-repair coupling factor [Acetonema longum]
MNSLFYMLQKDRSFQQGVRAFRRPSSQSLVYGLSGAPKSVLIAAAYQSSPRSIVIITGSYDAQEQYRTDLQALLPDVPVMDLPAADMVTFTVDAKSVESASRRLNLLSRLVNGEHLIVLAPAEAGMQKVLAKNEFLNNRLVLSHSIRLEREELIGSLVRFGYERVDEVNAMGQFSARGGIIDIFPINRDLPVRLELFGDEVDSIRDFDAASQRSLQPVDRAEVLPVIEPEHGAAMADFLTYLTDESVVVFDEPTRVREQMAKTVKENPEIKKQVVTWQTLAESAQKYTVLYLTLMAQKIPHAEPEVMISITAKSIAPFHRQIDYLIEEIKGWQSRHFAILLLLSTWEKAKAVGKSLAEEGVATVIAEAPSELVRGTVHIAVGSLSGGFELPHAQTVVITEQDIFGRQRKKRRLRVAKDQQINYFRDIRTGDYVVHVNHGIGKYVGVETLEVAGIHKDYLLIRYAGEDKLYLPTDQVHLLQKYIGNEGETPRLNRMGGSDWIKAKAKAKAAATDIAKELISLYAARQVTPGYAFAPDMPWQKEFEEAFVFEETPDQLAAIAEVKADMEAPRPMDRLLCGDVGFGKTEVAIRAAFKAVMSGRQVAVLVPTTVLAQQHFQTFSARFAGFGPTVGVISRFRSAKEQKATINRLTAGQIDILIGTHRILQSDVIFKDIGLLIVDEEQRFGVTQKEQLKKWQANIDVLTLTATPIPRTLHMSLAGVRDMSIIETPPEDRFPVQTYVSEYDATVIRDAIRREIKRGGQVYFVYNRVQTIDQLHRQLSEMLPDARIKVAHGQLPEELLEQVMLDFYEGHFDILICTSIIENGLDVPNANTMIVYDADYFGLSQLYQMRGRVGRSHRMAYAYFTYRRDKILTEVAEKRLQAIKEFAELGAGFKIAMRDLEIRGAGNLLGSQQHGHITSVGFEMYCRLLDEAVQELRSDAPVEIPPEPVLELKTEAYLSGDYIQDAMHKIEIYQRIAAVRSEEHIKDLLDELIDRFGDPPATVLNLITVARVKNWARQLGIRSLVERADSLEITFGDKPKVDVTAVMALRTRYPGRVLIIPGPPEIIRLKTVRLGITALEWLEKNLVLLEEKNDKSFSGHG